MAKLSTNCTWQPAFFSLQAKQKPARCMQHAYSVYNIYTYIMYTYLAIWIYSSAGTDSEINQGWWLAEVSSRVFHIS